MSDDDIQPSSGNVFSDLGFDPIESADLKARFVLMRKIKIFLLSDDALLPFTLEDGRFFSENDVLSILNGNFNTFSLETLTAIANRFGLAEMS